MKTGKITNIEPNGTFESYGSILTRNKVTLATGETFTFNSKGDFKKNVGDEIEFEVTNAQYGNAKLIYNPNRPQQQLKRLMMCKSLLLDSQVLLVQ